MNVASGSGSPPSSALGGRRTFVSFLGDLGLLEMGDLLGLARVEGDCRCAGGDLVLARIEDDCRCEAGLRV